MNASLHRSKIGHELAKRAAFKLPWGLVYRVTGERVDVSLYSIGELDVAKVAQAYGGGGHANASGFTVTLAALARRVRLTSLGAPRCERSARSSSTACHCSGVSVCIASAWISGPISSAERVVDEALALDQALALEDRRDDQRAEVTGAAGRARMAGVQMRLVDHLDVPSAAADRAAAIRSARVARRGERSTRR